MVESGLLQSKAITIAPVSSSPIAQPFSLTHNILKMLRTPSRTLLLLTIFAIADVVLSSPVSPRSSYAVKESFNVPPKWSRVGRAPGDHILNLQIGLKQSRFDDLERKLYEVSDPSDHRYGQHLTANEVDELIKPTPTTFELVHDWLASNGISVHGLSYSSAKDWVEVSLPVSIAETLLNTEYSVFQHRDGTYVVRAPEWSLPAHLHDHVDTIQPTNSFFRPAALRTMLKDVMPAGEALSTLKLSELPAYVSPSADLTVSQACNASLITPLCLRTLYGTINYTPKVPGKNRVGLTDYLGESNNRSDVSLFLQRFRPEAAPAAYQFKFDVLAGGSDQQSPDNATQLKDGTDLEGNLDAETIIGIDYPTPLTAYTTGGRPPFIPDSGETTDSNEPYLVWARHVLAQSDKVIPQVISTSYGEDEQTVPPNYARRVCQSFAQLGARGVSLLFASGDGGAGPDNIADCISNDGKNTTEFLPNFPASCPFVTTVGATKNFTPEVAALNPRNGFTSGGGFSNYFARPAYQNKAVSKYLATLGDEFAGLYNSSGRGYPDISAQGQSFATVWNGTFVRLDGTSASTPAASAIISLVNDALIAAGKPPLGFLNPWLYSKGYKGFTDVTSGSAPGCNTTGFPAVKGWDAVTGFGTPYFPEVSALALKAAD